MILIYNIKITNLKMSFHIDCIHNSNMISWTMIQYDKIIQTWNKSFIKYELADIMSLLIVIIKLDILFDFIYIFLYKYQ